MTTVVRLAGGRRFAGGVESTGRGELRAGLAWRGNLGLPNRSLQADLESRERLAEVFRLTRPAVVLAPYWEDAHPDHVAASRLVDDARFWSKLSKTEMAGERFWPPRLLLRF